MLEKQEIQAIAEAVGNAINQPTPAAPSPSHVVIPTIQSTSSTLDVWKMIGIALATLLSGMSVYHQQTTEKPATPVVALAPTPDPAQVKLTSDVADLQVRVKVLETPVKK